MKTVEKGPDNFWQGANDAFRQVLVLVREVLEKLEIVCPTSSELMVV
jgi:hypothetical protein